nr:NADH dehydrogenase subunit 2 [Cyphonocerus sanguineus klapperichi]
MKFYKMIFISMIFISTMISISSYTWMTMWMGLEMNLLSIIPLMQEDKNIMASESSIKYFMTQAIASTVIMMSIIMMIWKINFSVSMIPDSSLLLMMNSSLLLKMGMAPFHFWFPEVLEGLNWINCMLIMTWQKLAPMVLIMYNMKFSFFMTIIISFSMVISGIMAINQVSLRKIMAYSSINHMGWMIASMIIMKSIWMIYFLVYSILTINISMFMEKNKIFFLSQLFMNLNSSPLTKMFFMINFLSMSGLPPLLGFLPKWLTIQALVLNEFLALPLIMIVFTLIMIYVYIQIAMSSFILKINEKNWTLIEKQKISNMSLGIFNFLMVTSLIMVTMMFNMT